MIIIIIITIVQPDCHFLSLSASLEAGVRGLKVFLTYLFEVYEEFSLRTKTIRDFSIYKFHISFYFWAHYICKSNCVWRISEFRNVGN